MDTVGPFHQYFFSGTISSLSLVISLSVFSNIQSGEEGGGGGGGGGGGVVIASVA